MPPKKTPNASQVQISASNASQQQQQHQIVDFSTQVQEENKRLKQQASELQQQLTALQRETDQIISDQNTRINALEQDKSRLEQELFDQEKQIVASKAAVQQTLDRKAALKVEADQKLIQQIKSLQFSCEQQEKQKQQMIQQAQQLKIENQSLQEQIQEIGQQLQEKECDLQLLQQDYDKLSHKEKTLPTINEVKTETQRAIIQQQEPENDEPQPEVIEVRGEKKQPDQQNLLLVKAINEGRELISAQQQQIERLRAEIGQKEQNLQQVAQNSQDQLQEVEKLREENEMLKGQIEQQDAQIKQLVAPNSGASVSESVNMSEQSQLQHNNAKQDEKQPIALPSPGVRPTPLLTQHTLSIPGAQQLEQVNYLEMRSRINNLNGQVKELTQYKNRYFQLQEDFKALKVEYSTKSIENKRLLQTFNSSDNSQLQTQRSQQAQDQLSVLDKQIQNSNISLLNGLDTQPEFRKRQMERRNMQSNLSILQQDDDVQDLLDDLNAAEKEIEALKIENAMLLNGKNQYSEQILDLQEKLASGSNSVQQQKNVSPQPKFISVEVRDYAVQVDTAPSVFSGGSYQQQNAFTQTEDFFQLPQVKLIKSIIDEDGVEHFESAPDLYDIPNENGVITLRLVNNQLLYNDTFRKTNFNGIYKVGKEQRRIYNGIVQQNEMCKVGRAENEPQKECSAEEYRAECNRLQLENDAYRQQIAQFQAFTVECGEDGANDTNVNQEVQTEDLGWPVQYQPYVCQSAPVYNQQFQAGQPQMQSSMQPQQQYFNYPQYNAFQTTQQSAQQQYVGYTPIPQQQNYQHAVNQATSPTVPDVHDYQLPSASAQTEAYFVSADKYLTIQAQLKAATQKLTEQKLREVKYNTQQLNMESKQKELKAALQHIKYLNSENGELQRQITLLQESLAQYTGQAPGRLNLLSDMQNEAIKQQFMSYQQQISGKDALIANLKQLLEYSQQSLNEKVKFMTTQIDTANTAKTAAEEMKLEQLKQNLLILTQTGENEIVKAEGTAKVQRLLGSNAAAEADAAEMKKKMNLSIKAAKKVKSEYEKIMGQYNGMQQECVKMRAIIRQQLARQKQTEAVCLLDSGRIDELQCFLDNEKNGDF